MTLQDVLYRISAAVSDLGWIVLIAACVAFLGFVVGRAAILRYRRAQQIKLTRERLAHACGPATWYEREL